MVSSLLSDFGTRLADELTSDDAIDEGVPLLFDILRAECRLADGDPTSTASIISRLYARSTTGCSRSDSRSESIASGGRLPTIDPRFVNNAELADIRFKIDNRIFYAHRIVLVNASHELKQLIESTKSDMVEINDVSYAVFQVYLCKFDGD